MGTSSKPRILILNQNWLGDALFSTPAIRALRKKFPNAYIACLAPRRVAEALGRNPHLDEVLVYNERAMLVTLVEPFRIFWALKKRRFDTAFFLNRSKSKAFLALLAGIGRRIGYARLGRSWLLTQAVPPPGRMHKIDQFLYLIGQAGVPAAGRHPELIPSQEDRDRAARLLLSEGITPDEPFAVVHAGGNWDLKRWPVKNFIEWIRLYVSRNKGKVLLCGTASEEALAKQILDAFPDGRVVSMCGKTELGPFAELLKRAKIVLSNDSGPIHLAVSQKTRTVGVFGPTSPAETGPVSDGPLRVLWKDVGCSVPCYFRACDHRVCMDLLTPEEVFKTTEEVMAS
jgi:heptosyltransferase II